MANTFHDQLSGSDLHDNKVYPATGTELTPASQAAYDAHWAGKATTDAHTASTSNPHAVTKAQVGLGNADNTADANKPISSATQAALNAKQPRVSVTVGPAGSTGNDYTGNGTSDQTAILAAINSLGSAGGIVFLQAGVYNLTAAFKFGTPTKQVALIGAGIGRTVLRTSSGFSGFGLLYDYTSGLANCTIQGITFDGNGYAISGLQLGTCNNMTITACEFKGKVNQLWSVAIGVVNDADIAASASNNIVFERNYIHDNGNGTNETVLAVNCRNSRFDRNYYHSNTNSAFTFNLYGYCNNTTCDGNIFRNTQNAIFVLSCDTVSVQDNVIRAETNAQGGIFISNSEKVRVAGNVSQLVNSGGLSGSHIVIRDFVIGFDGHAQQFTKSRYIQVSDNLLYGGYYGILIGASTTGGFTYAASDIIIRNNLVYGTEWQCIRLGVNDTTVDIHDVEVVGNRLYGKMFDTGAIAIIGDSANNSRIYDIRIADNKILPSSRANAIGIDLSGCSGVVVSNNGIAGTGKGTFAGQDIYVHNGATTTQVFNNIGWTAPLPSNITLPNAAIITKAAAYTLTATDSVLLADATAAAFTVTLPSAIGIAGRQYTIKRVNGGSNSVSIGTTSSQIIDGASTKTLGAQFSYVTLVSDGVGWQVVGQGGTVS